MLYLNDRLADGESTRKRGNLAPVLTLVSGDLEPFEDLEESLHQADLAGLRSQSLLRALISVPFRLVLPPTRPVDIDLSPAHQQVRLGGIDALRGIAMVLGIYIHAALSYMPTQLSGLAWGIRESETSDLLDGLFWWIHTYRLGLFFLLAEFFSVLVHDKKGFWGFLRHRAGRLLVPFLVGVAILVPLTYFYCWCCGIVDSLVSDPSPWSFQVPSGLGRELPSPLHLWFLEDLMIISLAYAAYRGLQRLWRREPLQSTGDHVPRFSAVYSLLLPIVLALPTIALLWLEPKILLAHFNSFWPEPLRLVYFGYFFVAGAWLYQRRTTLNQTFAWPIVHTAASLAATAALLLFLPLALQNQLDPTAQLTFATLAALVAWLTIFGFLGLALRWFDRPHPAMQYLADASFWLYLCHLPLVCLLQLNCYRLPLRPELKCALVVGITVVVGLLSYQALVRYTRIGTLLHGPRTRVAAIQQ